MFDLIKTGDMSVVEFRAIAAGVLGDDSTPSRARINAAVNGTEPFGYKDQKAKENLASVMEDLLRLQKEFPIPINFSKIEQIAQLIRARREARERQIARWWYVFRTMDGYFLKIENGKVISVADDNIAAATQDQLLMMEVEKRLKKMGIRVNSVIHNGGRTVDQMFTTIEQFGFMEEACY
jgi:hypothetical protein